ncbi:RNase adapter RapZ [Alicyclobacillus kakegawensis]|uniref:RNase adapter RapZ n=1 Tax=Alicyclobacillus kakegawensis TaxID=392012 RepID=UPI000AA6FEB6|nr:RNase adapter RapZ [Alicyclobacillus kakegawensis]
MAAVSLQILILTGMSGAGKSLAMQALEDMGYYCVDNLPPALIPKFIDLIRQSAETLRKTALVCDLRGGDLFQPLVDTIRSLRANPDVTVTLVFFDGDDDTLVRRYKETRRRHPFVEGTRLLDAIQAERAALARVREESDIIIDTSGWKPAQLREEMVQRFGEGKRLLPVHIISFGFKYGVPIDADMIFDVRFLPNPHYIEALRPYTGEDGPVYDYVMQWSATREFLRRMEDLVDFLIPQYTREGKSHLVIGIGCTGGKHRSVAIARHLKRHIRANAEVYLTHRDSGREG